MKVVICVIICMVVRAYAQCRYVTIPVCGDDLTSTSIHDLGQQGQKGNIGYPGKAGPGGIPGEIGAKGRKGDLGPTGDAGKKGNPGNSGSKGDPGDNGVKGNPGERGPKGDTANLEEFKIEIRLKIQELENSLPPVSCATSSTNGSQMLWNGDYVFCEDGWTVFQRRFDGSVRFNRNWEEYKNGFGDFTGEFWLGLEKVYQQTKRRSCKLRVDLRSFDDQIVYAEYSDFSLGNEADLYRLSVQDYTGTSGDSMTGSSTNNGMAFSTKYRDNDRWGGNCAVRYGGGGGWWYGTGCGNSFLNNPWLRTTEQLKGITWYHWKGWSEGLKATTMKFRCD